MRIAGAVCLSITRQTLDYNGLVRGLGEGIYSTTGVDTNRDGGRVTIVMGSNTELHL